MGFLPHLWPSADAQTGASLTAPSSTGRHSGRPGRGVLLLGGVAGQVACDIWGRGQRCGGHLLVAGRPLEPHCLRGISGVLRHTGQGLQVLRLQVTPQQPGPVWLGPRAPQMTWEPRGGHAGGAPGASQAETSTLPRHLRTCQPVSSGAVVCPQAPVLTTRRLAVLP